MKYLITYHTKLDNGFIDERKIIIRYEYIAKRFYNNIASNKRTINIEMEELNWRLTEYLLITKTKLFYYQNL